MGLNRDGQPRPAWRTATTARNDPASTSSAQPRNGIGSRTTMPDTRASSDKSKTTDNGARSTRSILRPMRNTRTQMTHTRTMYQRTTFLFQPTRSHRGDRFASRRRRQYRKEFSLHARQLVSRIRSPAKAQEPRSPGVRRRSASDPGTGSQEQICSSSSGRDP
ncbi:hypothetical protein AURDEDRAFT_146342 [Auricularia subglabra TFB-10046 SS5]|nr:hypothetical protein AURDEDRAFT_146342 [Auricularia subglabra TFB-10046 SS5]